MAMTKKEIAAMEELREQLRLARAFRITDPVLPDVLPPDYSSNELSVGFYGFSYGYWPRVEEACSSSAFHAVGRTDKTTSQNSRKLYSSKLLAWKGIRNEVERDCMKRLAKIDKRIEELLSEPPK